MFNDYFIWQCMAISTGCSILQAHQLTLNPLNDFVISDEKMLNIIRSFNPKKALIGTKYQ